MKTALQLFDLSKEDLIEYAAKLQVELAIAKKPKPGMGREAVELEDWGLDQIEKAKDIRKEVSSRLNNIAPKKSGNKAGSAGSK
jgi:hypothetical protein